MERKDKSKLMKLAAMIFLATVMLQALFVSGCTQEDQTCNPSAPDCCEGLACIEVSPGTFKCEPPCEEHVGHSCAPGVRDCCDGLKCSTTTNKCECVLQQGATCVPGVDDDCCNLNCVQVSPNVYQCQ